MSFLKIGTRSRYALRFMIELAEVERAARSDETRRRGYVKLRTVASSQDISWRYLEQIAPALAEAGMVETGRGPLGGYRLLRNPATLTVAEILAVVESDEAPMKCFDPEVVDKYLQSVTLQDLLDGRVTVPKLIGARHDEPVPPDANASEIDEKA